MSLMSKKILKVRRKRFESSESYEYVNLNEFPPEEKLWIKKIPRKNY